MHDVDKETGVFEVEKSSGSRHTVHFGILSDGNIPSSTCKDWVRHHLPCKHFFTVFRHRENWSREKLPPVYLNSAYLSTDVQALQNHFSPLSTAPAKMVDGDTESPGGDTESPGGDTESPGGDTESPGGDVENNETGHMPE